MKEQGKGSENGRLSWVTSHELAQLRAGNEATWTSFHSRWTPMLESTAIAVVHNRATAEDVVQQAWLGFFGHIQNTAITPNTAISYLRRSVVNNGISVLRRETYRKTSPTGLDFDTLSQGQVTNPEDLITNEFSELELVKKLKSIIGENRARAIYLAISGIPYKEIAKRLDKPVGTIKSEVFHGKRIAREAGSEIF